MEAAEAGLERLIVIPYFLTVGLHLRRDLPKLVAAAKEKHPNFEIAVGQSLEGHPLMPSIILGRVQEVLKRLRRCSTDLGLQHGGSRLRRLASLDIAALSLQNGRPLSRVLDLMTFGKSSGPYLATRAGFFFSQSRGVRT